MSYNFYSLQNRPKTVCSDAGSKEYHWTYFDKTGKLKSDKKDFYQAIQDAKDSTDYKRLIKQGEDFRENGQGIYMDTTKLGNSFTDIDQYLSRIAALVNEAKNPTTEAGVNQPESQQNGVKSQPESGEVNSQGGTNSEQGGNAK